jgi:hypothetical protein
MSASSFQKVGDDQKVDAFSIFFQDNPFLFRGLGTPNSTWTNMIIFLFSSL